MSAIVHRIIVALLLPKHVTDLVKYCQAIVSAMTGNTWFPTPNPALATFADKLAKLDAAETVATTRAKGTAAARDVARKELVSAAHALASQVQQVADANPDNAGAIIKSASMSEKKVAIRAPRVFGAKYGLVSGSVSLIAPSAGRKASYDWQYSVDGGKTWVQVDSTLKARTIIDGLPFATSVLLRYRVVLTTGTGDWSQPISILVK